MRIMVLLSFVFFLLACGPKNNPYLVENKMMEYYEHLDENLEYSILDWWSDLEDSLIKDSLLIDRSGIAYAKMFQDLEKDYSAGDRLEAFTDALLAVDAYEIDLENFELDSSIMDPSAIHKLALSKGSRSQLLNYSLIEGIQSEGDLSPSALISGINQHYLKEDFNNPYIRLKTLMLLHNFLWIQTEAFPSVKLPAWSEEEPDITKLKKHNVFPVVVNAKNEILVRGEKVNLEELKDMTIHFLTKECDSVAIQSPPIGLQYQRKGLISLKNYRETNYKVYLDTYNELKAAYQHIWNEMSQKHFGHPYSDDMELEKRKAIRDLVPFMISEAEPLNYGE